MTFHALADFVCGKGVLPVAVDDVLGWVRENTDHKHIKLHPVGREHKGFRGAFRRKAVPLSAAYGADYDILVDILYGIDLPDEWKRLVIVKEVLHVFDPQGHCVDAPDKLENLIPVIIDPTIGAALPEHALNDHWGQFRAMAILMPPPMRNQLAASVESGQRTVEEVATFVRLPEARVDMWLRKGTTLDLLME